MHVHAFSMYISVGMLNHIQEQVPVMSQLTAQLRCQSLRHYISSQLHNNTAALTSSLHHHQYIRSCQTSLSMLLKLMPNVLHLCARLSTASQNKYFSLTQLLFCFSLETPGKSAQNTTPYNSWESFVNGSKHYRISFSRQNCNLCMQHLTENTRIRVKN